ncbi:hypothetical protein LTR62_008176 [Meristemomyces frigidus]|uniref:Transcriptional regulatory protein RXT2 N-terminal domain-containing protein n=1 Tax=Meristemomyces frigidus TaxID=1508187 RepID=A0AAN7TDW0_9PEZI|nr:hypothetical protein LTR62_008176 [Meristemomyces frigidus]
MATSIAIAETIRGMKLALRRQRATSPAPSLDSSDDDEAAEAHSTNRGNKLRPSAQYIKQGQLDTTGGQARYKRKIQHAGHERWIIKKRPRLYDEDGDVVDPADIPSDLDEGEAAAYGEAGKEDPFGDVKLDSLLRPLTSAAELMEHPSLSLGFTSKALTRMVGEIEAMARRERAGVWRAKRLLAILRGEGGWMGLGEFVGEGDEGLLDDEEEGVMAEGPGEPDTGLQMDGTEVDNVMEGVEVQDHVETANGTAAGQDESNTAGSGMANTHGVPQLPNGDPQNPTVTSLLHPGDEDNQSSRSGSNPSGAPSHSMTTRARARSPQLPISPSPSPSDSASIPPIHPWFTAPNPSTHTHSHLPPAEHEDTLKVLLLYIQKSENILRHLDTLYTGLARAERQRHRIAAACKAEGHMVPDPSGNGKVVTELSDGEDWIDVEAWGLVGDKRKLVKEDGRLEKGRDEVDEGAEEEGRRVGVRRRRVVGR